MASIGRKITGVSSLLTATLSQTRRSVAKYRNHEHSAGSAFKIFNKIGSVTARAAPEREHHKFFHAATSNVKNDNINADANSSSILDLGDEEKFFSGFTTEELIDSLFRLNLICCQSMVMASSKYELYKLHIFHAARAHFCAGENVESVSRELRRIRDLGLKGIHNYAVDGAALDNAACDSNLNHFLGIVSSMRSLRSRLTSLRREETHANLDINQETDLNLAERRLFRLCGACEAASLPLLVDAENTAVQPAIDYSVFRAFYQFNGTHMKYEMSIHMKYEHGHGCTVSIHKKCVMSCLDFENQLGHERVDNSRGSKSLGNFLL